MYRFKYSRSAVVIAGMFVLAGAALAYLSASGVCYMGACSDARLGWVLPLASGVMLAALALALIDSDHVDATSRGEVSNAAECPACGRLMGEDWRICPYCGAMRTCELTSVSGDAVQQPRVPTQAKMGEGRM